jgi:hypothetical protein
LFSSNLLAPDTPAFMRGEEARARLRDAALPPICLVGTDARGSFGLSAPTGAKVKKSKVKRAEKPLVPNTKRTASILIEADTAAFSALVDVQAAYADAGNLLVPDIIENRCWNRVLLHNTAYDWLRPQTPLGSQMVRNTFRTVCGAYASMRSNGEIEDDKPVPVANFRKVSACPNGHQFHSDIDAARSHAQRGEQMIAGDAEPMNSGRPRLIRVARRKSTSDEGRCNPPQCFGLADVGHHVSL